MLGSVRGALRVTALVLAASALAACTKSYAQRGFALYDERRYVEAAEVFERTEYRLDEASLRQQAEYGAGRGMTLLALGDREHARHWLGFAYRAEQRAPGSLSPQRRAELDAAWQRLNGPEDAPVTPVRDVATRDAPR